MRPQEIPGSCRKSPEEESLILLRQDAGHVRCAPAQGRRLPEQDQGGSNLPAAPWSRRSALLALQETRGHLRLFRRHKRSARRNCRAARPDEMSARCSESRRGDDIGAGADVFFVYPTERFRLREERIRRPERKAAVHPALLQQRPMAPSRITGLCDARSVASGPATVLFPPPAKDLVRQIENRLCAPVVFFQRDDPAPGNCSGKSRMFRTVAPRNE